MVKIRLLKQGAKKRPYYKVVVANSTSPRDGRFIEIVGRYQPLNDAESCVLDMEKIDSWIKNGAQPTKTVSDLIRKQKKAVN